MSQLSDGFIYQTTGTFFAQTDAGIEPLAEKEAERLGAVIVQRGFKGFSFSGTKEVLYRMNYRARLISRILAPLATFDADGPEAVYAESKRLDWPKIFTLDHRFAVFGTVSGSRITHSKYAALKVKDAIADSFRESCGAKRPDVDTKNPDIRIFLYVSNDKATLYLDTSGESLHRRGYREMSVPAPLRETVAAAIIQLSGWNGERPLYDPMCGSGTLLAEALMHRCRIPAGYLRERFGCELMPDFDPVLWQTVRKEADSLIREIEPGLIGGGDIDPAAFAASSANLQKLPGGDELLLRRRDFRELDKLENRTIVTNPPYGIRLGETHQAAALITSFGDFLKQKCAGSTAYVYFGDRELIKHIGLRTAFKKPLKSGGLDGRLCRFDMYA